MSKLLGSFFIYFLFFWLFPMLQIDWASMNFFEFYGWITGTLLLTGVISYILVTPEFFKRKKIVTPERMHA